MDGKTRRMSEISVSSSEIYRRKQIIESDIMKAKGLKEVYNGGSWKNVLKMINSL